jgi:hypothetical protein
MIRVYRFEPKERETQILAYFVRRVKFDVFERLYFLSIYKCSSRAFQVMNETIPYYIKSKRVAC